MASKQSYPPTFSQFIGVRLKEWRERFEYKQEEIATAANRVLLPWRKTTVGSIEIGRRELDLEEFLLLPLVFELVHRDHGRNDSVSLADLFKTDDSVLMRSKQPERFIMRAEQLRRLLTNEPHRIEIAKDASGHQFPKLDVREKKYRAKDLRAFAQLCGRLFPEHSPSVDFYSRVQQEARQEAEATAARKLGVPAIAVTLAAYGAFNMSLTHRRELELRRKSEGKTPRQVQGLRAQITRRLLKELEPVLAKVRKKP